MTFLDPISIQKVGRQHLCNQNHHTEVEWSEGERTKSKQLSTLEN